MILNVSGRTDIVAFYTPWFIRRLKEGYVDVRNPFFPEKVSRIYFEDVDCILFCTKNPLPIIPYLKDIKKPIIFHITITPYKKDIEPNVPEKKEIIAAVKKIADIIGRENVFIRYDPIFLSQTYSTEYHIKAFARLCSLLRGSTKTIIVSFLDNYKNVQNNISTLKVIPFKEPDYEALGKSFSKSAEDNKMIVQTCAENRNLVEYGFTKGDCLSKELAYKITGKKYPKWKSRGKENCNCVELVDIGVYNTCSHFCKYCYANYDEKKVKINREKHDINSSLLIGNLEDKDIITIRK